MCLPLRHIFTKAHSAVNYGFPPGTTSNCIKSARMLLSQLERPHGQGNSACPCSRCPEWKPKADAHPHQSWSAAVWAEVGIAMDLCVGQQRHKDHTALRDPEPGNCCGSHPRTTWTKALRFIFLLCSFELQGNLGVFFREKKETVLHSTAFIWEG